MLGRTLPVSSPEAGTLLIAMGELLLWSCSTVACCSKKLLADKSKIGKVMTGTFVKCMQRACIWKYCTNNPLLSPKAYVLEAICCRRRLCCDTKAIGVEHVFTLCECSAAARFMAFEYRGRYVQQWMSFGVCCGQLNHFEKFAQWNGEAIFFSLLPLSLCCTTMQWKRNGRHGCNIFSSQNAFQ